MEQTVPTSGEGLHRIGRKSLFQEVISEWDVNDETARKGKEYFKCSDMKEPVG